MSQRYRWLRIRVEAELGLKMDDICEAENRSMSNLACTAIMAYCSARKARKASKPNVSKSAPFALPEWVPIEQWNAWIEGRKKAPTEFSKKMAISKLEALKEQGHHPAAVLAQSAFNGWTGLFPIKAAL